MLSNEVLLVLSIILRLNFSYSRPAYRNALGRFSTASFKNIAAKGTDPACCKIMLP